jgi:hypothetical protein
MVITYELLDKALKNMGLTRVDKDKQIVYFSEDNIPIIVYPQRPVTEIVHPWHLSMARRQVIERGLAAGQKEFEQALERAAA